MKKLYYSCGFGFRTFDLEEAKKYCLQKNFNLIHIISGDNLSVCIEVGYFFYDEKNHIWKES